MLIGEQQVCGHRQELHHLRPERRDCMRQFTSTSSINCLGFRPVRSILSELIEEQAALYNIQILKLGTVWSEMASNHSQ
jgi:hypothetical protein